MTKFAQKSFSVSGSTSDLPEEELRAKWEALGLKGPEHREVAVCPVCDSLFYVGSACEGCNGKSEGEEEASCGRTCGQAGAGCSACHK